MIALPRFHRRVRRRRLSHGAVIVSSTVSLILLSSSSADAVASLRVTSSQAATQRRPLPAARGSDSPHLMNALVLYRPSVLRVCLAASWRLVKWTCALIVETGSSATTAALDQITVRVVSEPSIAYSPSFWRGDGLGSPTPTSPSASTRTRHNSFAAQSLARRDSARGRQISAPGALVSSASCNLTVAQRRKHAPLSVRLRSASVAPLSPLSQDSLARSTSTASFQRSIGRASLYTPDLAMTPDAPLSWTGWRSPTATLAEEAMTPDVSPSPGFLQWSMVRAVNSGSN